MKSVLLLGATGFIGRYIARHLNAYGWRIFGIGTRSPENAPSQYLSQYQQVSLPSPNLPQIIQQFQPDLCIHCVGRASVGLSVTDPQADFSASVDVTFNVLDSLRRFAPQCRLIYLSSAAVYGNPEELPICETYRARPISPYGFHKLMSEQLCTEFFKVYGLPTAAVRIFSAYGPGLRRQVVWDICQKALSNPVLSLWGTGSESRDFIHAQDVASAIQIVAEHSPFQADVYNLASGKETKIKDLASTILSQLDRNISIEFDGSNTQANPVNWQADIGKLSALGFEPKVSLERGVSVFAQWCLAEIVGC